MRAPEIQASEWLNTDTDLSLSGLRGRVVVLHAFQMLCPGCVTHGIPQAQRLQGLSEELTVLGLHSVFEHHDVMGPDALRAFAHEYRITFPVAVDAREPNSRLPKTMKAYQLQGTPSLILIDRSGDIRFHAFGRPSDLEVGLQLGNLLREEVPPAKHESETASGCDATGCAV